MRRSRLLVDSYVFVQTVRQRLRDSDKNDLGSRLDLWQHGSVWKARQTS